MPEKHKEYYSTREAAAILNVAVSTIQLWTNNGLLTAWVTGGGHRRITRSSVEHILKQQQVLTTSSAAAQLTVMVVEDDAQQLRLYEKQFKASQLDVNVTTATDGYEGLMKIGRILPGVIIADLMMPNLDGFQMIRAMKKMPELQNSLIIVVTGLRDEEIKAKGGLPADVQVFVKPVPFEKLEVLISQRLNIKAA